MIVTFYSYKGGVGRTQLLANIAAYLCFYEHRKVLLIDWDIEAPGLHFYFKKANLKHKGLLELLSDYCDLMQREISVPEETIESEFKEKLSQYIAPNIEESASGKGRIDLMPAGLYDDFYTKKTNSFDWVKFYEALDGGFFIELLKKYLKTEDYEYILIDSRTGVSDYSGICNIQIPDVNVILFAPIDQNVVGGKRVIDRIRNSEYIKKSEKRHPIIFPILSRLDPTNNAQKGKWVKKFRKDFREDIEHIVKLALGISIDKDITQQVSDAILDEYISATLLEYQTDISYGEKILFNKNEEKIEIKTIEQQYKNISELLRIFNGYPPVDFKLLHYLSNQTGTINDFFKGILDVTGGLKSLATIQNASEDSEGEEQSYKEVENIYRQLVEVDPKEYTPLLIGTLHKLGELQLKGRKLDEAEDTYLKILEIYKELSKTKPQIYKPNVAESSVKLADVQYSKASYEKAEKSYDEALTIYKALAQVSDQSYYLHVAGTFSKLAELQRAKNQLNKAEAYYKETLEIYRKLALVNQQRYQPYVATSLDNLGNLQRGIKKFDEAEESYKESIKIREELNSETYLPTIANTCNNLGMLLYSTKKIDEAEEYFNKALTITRKLSENNSKLYLPRVADTLNNLATLQRDKKELNNAEISYGEALQIKKNFAMINPDTKHKLGMTQVSMAIFYQKYKKDKEKSVQLAVKAMKNLQTALEIPRVKNSMQLASDVLKNWGIEDVDAYLQEKAATN